VKDYTIDNKTGFLTPDPLCPLPHFNAEQKTLFLSRFRDFFNVSKAAKAALTTRALVTKHLKEDKAFAEAFQAIQDELLDEIEESLYKQSVKSPIAAMQFLRSKRPAEWGVSKKPVEGPDKTADKLKKLLEG
jgi:hypothetical protein